MLKWTGMGLANAVNLLRPHRVVLVGVQAASSDGTQAALFYLAAYTFMVAGSFGVVTLVGRRGDGRHSLDDYRGLGRDRPLAGLVGLSTYLPMGQQQAAAKLKADATSQPVFMAHGQFDPVVPAVIGQLGAATMKELGFECDFVKLMGRPESPRPMGGPPSLDNTIGEVGRDVAAAGIKRVAAVLAHASP